MAEKEELKKQIKELSAKRNAVILAHVYQQGDIQDIADFVGDSLDLSKKAVDIKADVIVFCGVLFMAETAAILNPHKTVLLPDMNAGCGLADMATHEAILKYKEQHPGICVVSYVNSTALVKSVSDTCCTSANAVKIVQSLSADNILFVPDKNLGSYVAEHTDKNIIFWNGYCYVHENITTAKLLSLKEKHPDAEIIVHPECPASVRHLADYAGSTSQMSRYVKQSPKDEFIVGSEDNFIYRLQSDNPGKLFYPVNSSCEGMNAITLEKLKNALEHMQHKITVPEETRIKAKKALDNMLTVS